MRILGRRGFIVSARDQFGNPVVAQTLNRNFAVSANGQLFRRVRGRFQPVFARVNGQIVPVALNQNGQVQIANQLGNPLASQFGNFQNPLAGIQGGVAAVNPAIGAAPFIDGNNGQQCGVGAFRNCFGVPGGHGAQQFGNPGRPVGEPNVLGADGKLTPAACGNLNATFCGGFDPRQEQQLVRDNELRAVNALLLTPLGRQLGRSGLQRLAANALRIPAVANVYSRLIESLVAQAAPGLGALIGQVKSDLKQSIRAQGLDGATVSTMEGEIDQAEVVVAPPRDQNGNIDPAGNQDFGEICGTFGTSPEAATVPKSEARPKSRVFLCPGFILRALALGGTQGLAANIAFSLGHELVHCNCGADSVFRRNAQGVEVKVAESPLRGKYRGLLACLGVGEKEGGETAADWLGGFQQIARRLEGKSPAEAFQFVKASVSPLCGSRGDGVHPPGATRIQRMPAELLARLGCPATSPPATCRM